VIVKGLASFLAFAAMAVGFFAYIGSLGIRAGAPPDRANLSMDVADINNVVVESNVLFRGVPVGKVSGIDSSVSTATIHFYIDGKYKVPADSLVRLENLSALGESYLELEPQSSGGPAFRDGQRIAADYVKQPPSISELGTSVVRVLNELNPGQLQNVIDEADTALPDPYAVLPNLQRASLLLRNTTTDLNGRGKEALENVQSLLENAGFVGPALAGAAPSVRDVGPGIQTLWNNGANIILRDDSPGSVYVFGKFLQRIQKMLDDRAPDIRVLTEPLMPNINAIAASLATIDSSQILGNLLAAVPADGAINLHVTLPDAAPGTTPDGQSGPTPEGQSAPTPEGQAGN
jgi:phospholipid/cholesterol/gamma-HCH transport system substrate-binding protein